MKNPDFKSVILFLICVGLWSCRPAAENQSPQTDPRQNQAETSWVVIEKEVLVDRIRGGILGQILGSLCSHPETGVTQKKSGEFNPALPRGAWSENDTDFEWVYIRMIQLENEAFLNPGQLAELWKKVFNNEIRQANRYARHLMDLGLEPPYTGNPVLNPWSGFSVTGQFVAETFGLAAPAMPQTAARIGLNYAKVAAAYEPAQVTQLVTGMVATAFTTDDIERILDAGMQSVDPDSRVYRIVRDVWEWYRRHPDDWKETQRRLQERYSSGGGTRDRLGYELNTGWLAASLLYGKGDFAKTLDVASRTEWATEHIAATAGCVLGVVLGYRRMMSRGWPIVDRYRNETRQNMPDDETITSFADRVVDVAAQVIRRNGGGLLVEEGIDCYRIAAEQALPVERLPDPQAKLDELKKHFEQDIDTGIRRCRNRRHRARAVYLAVCLDLAKKYQQRFPILWSKAVPDLRGYWKLMQDLYFDSPHRFPAKSKLQTKFKSAGVAPPEAEVLPDEIWYLEPEWVDPEGR